MTKQDQEAANLEFTDLVFEVDGRAGKTHPFTHPATDADFDAIAVALTGAALVMKGIIDPTAQRLIEMRAVTYRRDAKRMRDAGGCVMTEIKLPKPDLFNPLTSGDKVNTLEFAHIVMRNNPPKRPAKIYHITLAMIMEIAVDFGAVAAPAQDIKGKTPVETIENYGRVMSAAAKIIKGNPHPRPHRVEVISYLDWLATQYSHCAATMRSLS